MVWAAGPRGIARRLGQLFPAVRDPRFALPERHHATLQEGDLFLVGQAFVDYGAALSLEQGTGALEFSPLGVECNRLGVPGGGHGGRGMRHRRGGRLVEQLAESLPVFAEIIFLLLKCLDVDLELGLKSRALGGLLEHG